MRRVVITERGISLREGKADVERAFLTWGEYLATDLEAIIKDWVFNGELPE